MKKEALIGLILIILGIGIFAYYNNYIQPRKESSELLVEGKLLLERSDKESVNNSINMFNRIIARYPETPSAYKAYYYIAQGYEKLGLNRLAYLKYGYLLKTRQSLSQEMRAEITAKMARLNIMKLQTEEGIHQLLSMLNRSTNKDFRSRIYTELGHTYLKNSSYKKAGRMFDIAISENGSNEEAIIGKARTYKRMGRDEKAFDLYEYFLKYYGNFSNYTADINRAYLNQAYSSGYNSYRQGAYYRAIGFFRRVLRNYPGSKKSENALYWTGESYFSIKKYQTAVSYFNRVLSNNYYHKDQDARLNKGYSYFMDRKFDLAAREFQVYIDTYPEGRHIEKARKWKKISTKEIIYRIKDRQVPEVEDEETDKSNEENNESQESEEVNQQPGKTENNKTGFSDTDSKVRSVEYSGKKLKLENVAEL